MSILLKGGNTVSRSTTITVLEKSEKILHLENIKRHEILLLIFINATKDSVRLLNGRGIVQ